MKSISRRDFINISGIAAGAVFMPSFLLRHTIKPTELVPPWFLQSWYLKVQSNKCRTRLDAEAQLQTAKLSRN